MGLRRNRTSTYVLRASETLLRRNSCSCPVASELRSPLRRHVARRAEHPAERVSWELDSGLLLSILFKAYHGREKSEVRLGRSWRQIGSEGAKPGHSGGRSCCTDVREDRSYQSSTKIIIVVVVASALSFFVPSPSRSAI